MEIFEPLEITQDGKPTGKWRLTRRTDDPATEPVGLCDHEHDTPEEAAKCPVALQARNKAFGGDPLRREYRALTRVEQGQIQDIKAAAEALHNALAVLGPSREISLALTRVEEAVMWGTKHVTATPAETWGPELPPDVVAEVLALCLRGIRTKSPEDEHRRRQLREVLDGPDRVREG